MDNNQNFEEQAQDNSIFDNAIKFFGIKADETKEILLDPATDQIAKINASSQYLKNVNSNRFEKILVYICLSLVLIFAGIMLTTDLGEQIVKTNFGFKSAINLGGSTVISVILFIFLAYAGFFALFKNPATLQQVVVTQDYLITKSTNPRGVTSYDKKLIDDIYGFEILKLDGVLELAILFVNNTPAGDFDYYYIEDNTLDQDFINTLLQSANYIEGLTKKDVWHSIKRKLKLI
jgi:hypothetical protein